MELRIEYLSPHELTPYKGNAEDSEFHAVYQSELQDGDIQICRVINAE